MRPGFERVESFLFEIGIIYFLVIFAANVVTVTTYLVSSFYPLIYMTILNNCGPPQVLPVREKSHFYFFDLD